MASPAPTVWFTGLSGAGKTTTAAALVVELLADQIPAVHLDGDDLRRGLSADLGFSFDDRAEAVRRAGAVALVVAQQGSVAVVSMISPQHAARQAVRSLHEAAGVPFVEVYVATPLEVCESRDPKKLYQLARQGSSRNMTGVNDPYDVPSRPELVISTDGSSVPDLVRLVRSISNL